MVQNQSEICINLEIRPLLNGKCHEMNKIKKIHLSFSYPSAISTGYHFLCFIHLPLSNVGSFINVTLSSTGFEFFMSCKNRICSALRI